MDFFSNTMASRSPSFVMGKVHNTILLRFVYVPLCNVVYVRSGPSREARSVFFLDNPIDCIVARSSPSVEVLDQYTLWRESSSVLRFVGFADVPGVSSRNEFVIF